MKILLSLTMVALAIILSSCSFNKTRAAQTKEVIFEDGYHKSLADEIVFDDAKLMSVNGGTSPYRSSAESNTAEDKSQISVITDSYGNKSETRCFENHPRLQCVRLITSTTGEKNVVVHGRGGEMNSLPENMLDRILTASADELASAAGIFQPEMKKSVTINQIIGKPSNNQPLQPLPSYKFPAPTQIEVVPTLLENEPQADEPQASETPETAAENPSAENGNN